MELTVLEVLYIVLIIFISIIWTLLSIALYKLIKILNVAVEVTWYYYKVKQMLDVYSQIPAILIEKIIQIFSSKEVEEEEEK